MVLTSAFPTVHGFDATSILACTSILGNLAEVAFQFARNIDFPLLDKLHVHRCWIVSTNIFFIFFSSIQSTMILFFNSSFFFNTCSSLFYLLVAIATMWINAINGFFFDVVEVYTNLAF